MIFVLLLLNQRNLFQKINLVNMKHGQKSLVKMAKKKFLKY